MKVLELNRKTFILMCIIPNQNEIEGPLKRFANILFSFIVLTLVSTITLSSMAYTVEFASIDLEKTLYAVFQISAYWGQFYMMVVSYRIWPKLAKLFPKLQEIYDESKWISIVLCKVFSVFVWLPKTTALQTSIRIPRDLWNKQISELI